MKKKTPPTLETLDPDYCPPEILGYVPKKLSSRAGTPFTPQTVPYQEVLEALEDFDKFMMLYRGLIIWITNDEAWRLRDLPKEAQQTPDGREVAIYIFDCWVKRRTINGSWQKWSTHPHRVVKCFIRNWVIDYMKQEHSRRLRVCEALDLVTAQQLSHPSPEEEVEGQEFMRYLDAFMKKKLKRSEYDIFRLMVLYGHTYLDVNAEKPMAHGDFLMTQKQIRILTKQAQWNWNNLENP